MPTAITHDPTFTTPVSSTNTAVVRWSGTAGSVLQNSGVLIDGSNNITGVGTIASGAITSSGAIIGTQVDILAAGDLRLQDTTGGQYVALEANGTTTTHTLTLPAAQGAADTFLKNNGSGALTWGAAGGALQSTRVNGSRLASAGSGNEVINEVWFTTTTVLVIALDKVSSLVSWGWGDDGAYEAMVEADAGSFTQTDGRFITIYNSSAENGYIATLTSFHSTNNGGCTIAWTRIGTGLDVHYIMLFLRYSDALYLSEIHKGNRWIGISPQNSRFDYQSCYSWNC